MHSGEMVSRQRSSPYSANSSRSNRKRLGPLPPTVLKAPRCSQPTVTQNGTLDLGG